MKLQEVILRGLAAARPAAASVPIGVLYFSTDTVTLERNNGSSWDSYSASGGGITQLTGDVTAGPGGGSLAATIANDAVTNTKLANVATATIKGRSTAGTGDPEDLTGAQATALLSNMVGDSGAGGTKGLVPAPASGDATKFLRGDATWAAAAGGAGEVLRVNRQLTSSEINSINTTPIELVAAPGSDRIIVPIRVLWWATRTASAFSVDPTWRIRYAGIATDLFGGVAFSLQVASAGDAYRDGVRTDFNFGYGGSDPRNKALQVSGSLDSTGGTGTVRVSVSYWVGQW